TGNISISTNEINTGAGNTLIEGGSGPPAIAAAGNYAGAPAMNAGVLVVQNNSVLGGTAKATTASTAAMQMNDSNIPSATALGPMDPWWDINGATAGTGGATPSGTWNTTGAA